MPIPVPNCPPAPHAGSVGADPGQGVVPGMGVFIIERAKLKLPLSRWLQRLHTAFPAMLLPSFKATAAVQLFGVTPPTGVVQYAGFRAVSKNGCGVRVFGLTPAQLPPASACWFCG